MKRRQCVCCGFASSKGTKYNGQFVCSGCENDRIEEESARYEEEEWAELNRLDESFQIKSGY